MAAALKGAKIDKILCSPYLRVIQTAQPLAHALGQSLHVENALAEFKHHPSRIPPSGSRVAIFPEVDDSYEPMLPGFANIGASGQEPIEDYLRRLLLLAHELPRKYPNQTVACFSHAASIGLVAALTGERDLARAGTFAPCGIWKLSTADGGASWKVEARGEDNSGHVTSNDPSTYSWGFAHTKSKEACQAAWERALTLGPTRLEEATALGGGHSAARGTPMISSAHGVCSAMLLGLLGLALASRLIRRS